MNTVYLAHKVLDVTQIEYISLFVILFIIFAVLAFLSQGGTLYKRETGEFKGWGKRPKLTTSLLWSSAIIVAIVYVILLIFAN